MATEGPLLHDGSQTVSGQDLRNSTQSGTTRMGPNGSGQFLAVRLSTTTERTVNVSTVTGQGVYGLLQNKPSTGEAADVGIFGPSKAVAGSTAIAAGQRLMPDTSGCLIPYSSAADRAACAVALSVPGAVGEVFTAMIYGYGAQGSLA